MSLDIPATDFGRIHVFALSAEAAARLDTADRAAALHSLFGLPLDDTYVDVLHTGALAGLTLADYIHQGYDIPRDSMDTAALNALTGPVALVMSRAFRGRPGRIDTSPDLHHVASLSAPAPAPPGPPLSSDSAKGILGDTPGRKPVSSGAMSGRVAMVALLVLFALVALMIWIAG